MFRLAVVGLAVADARDYAKGFVRMPRNAAVPHATITDEMRAAAPAKLDWTETAGAVSPVKDQGQCGSCWAFSATQGIESGVFMTDGKAPPALSPQQITSCDKTDGGCNGGDLPSAFDYVESAGGVDSEADYPYTSGSGRTGSCKSHKNVAKVTDYKYAVPPCQGGSCSGQDEDGLKAALNSFGPLSVCVNAENFNSYYGGVVRSGSCSGAYNKLDHCVQLVGYDTTASTPYWKVKNSWASDWGEAGFIRLPMGENACGIADEAMYVTATMSGADRFEAFKAKYGKVYNGIDEESSARQTYEANMNWAEANSDDSVQYGETRFADLNTEQYRVEAGLGYKANALANLPHLGVHEYAGEELAASIDWTTQGAVTPVKDQGQCGSCWAFSTTGGMEGAWQIASGSLTSMSEQQLVDCSTQNSGCNGGSMELAFNYAGTTNVATEASYPYTARDGSCKSSYTTAIPRGGVTGYKSVGQSTDSLKSALMTGPVSVAIEADQMAFQLYSGGVLKSGCGTNLDHGVLAVGYTADAFKVKNSWGSSWGENGYLQISTSGNTCGIHSDASYPTVSASVQV